MNEKELDVEKIRQQFGFYQANEDRIAGEIARYEGELEEVKKSLTDGVADDRPGKKKASKGCRRPSNPPKRRSRIRRIS